MIPYNVSCNRQRNDLLQIYCQDFPKTNGVWFPGPQEMDQLPPFLQITNTIWWSWLQSQQKQSMTNMTKQCQECIQLLSWLMLCQSQKKIILVDSKFQFEGTYFPYFYRTFKGTTTIIYRFLSIEHQIYSDENKLQ